MMTAPAYSLRAARPTDGGFLFSSWLKSARRGATKAVHPPDYYEGQKAVITALLEDGARVQVACGHDEDYILGFAVGETSPEPALHFVYVRKIYRGHGIARALCESIVGPEPARLLVTYAPTPEIRKLVTNRGWALSTLTPLYRALARPARMAKAS